MCGLWVFIHMWGDQKFLSGIFLRCSLSSLETGSLIWTQLISLASLASLFWGSLFFPSWVLALPWVTTFMQVEGTGPSLLTFTWHLFYPWSHLPSPSTDLSSQFSFVFWAPRSLWRCTLWSLVPGCAPACVSPDTVPLSGRRPGRPLFVCFRGCFLRGISVHGPAASVSSVPVLHLWGTPFSYLVSLVFSVLTFLFLVLIRSC